MKSRSRIKPHQATLLIAAAATLVALTVPVVQKALLPLQYLNTHLHEFSHAWVAIATGARVDRILVNADGSGTTPVMGGSILLIASAGYVGASIFGAIMILAGRTEKGARGVLAALAAILLISTVIWVRGDTVGFVAGLGWLVALGGMAFVLRGRALSFAAQFLGIQQCLNAVHSLLTLVQLSVSTEVHSDATILDQATGISPIVWAIGWSVFSLALVGWSLKRSWEPSLKKA